MSTELRGARECESVVSDSYVSRLTSCPPLRAICELIDNALDADAEDIRVMIHDGDGGRTDKIEVIDTGDGIDATRVDGWGFIYESWKKDAKVTRKKRPMAGSLGVGRLRALGLGRHVQ